MAAEPPPPTIPWVPPADGRPPWDQEEADWFIGKYVLVGITYLKSDGETAKEQAQYHGRIVSADREKGFAIECEGAWAGRTMGLPPVTQAFFPANPGEYRLRSTGETIADPDLVTTWSLVEPVRS